MMSKAESHFTDMGTDADWRQLEAFVDQLHASARAPIKMQQFYRELLEGCVTLLAAEGGAVWVPGGSGRWRVECGVNCETASEGTDGASHHGLLQAVAGSAEPQIVLPHSRNAAEGENPTALVLALVAVKDACVGSANAIIELHLRSGSSPEVQQGWRELLAIVSQVAAEFHVHQQLRTLRSERGFYDQSLALMRRFQQSTDLRQTAFEIANEGRRFVGADRLSLLVQRGKHWQLLAVSGVDRVEARADVAKRLQMLAAATANWGDPVEYANDSQDELPPELSELVERHVDESQARRLVAVPVEFERSGEGGARQSRVASGFFSEYSSGFSSVLVAEQFGGEVGEFSRQRVLELAGLCEPALRQAVALDRFPVRGCLRWADRWAEVREKWGLTKLAVASVAALAVLLALVFVQVDFEVEASATLRPVVERDVFATTDGKVIDVRIVHGEQVAAGEVLAVLSDPLLALDAERVAGEIATTRKRLEAIAVARTDRQVREETSGETLPLSAEAEQLKKRLASLQSQQEILERRREALTLRSPIAGTVLTLDVQNLLRTRPVARGQVLFTVADTSAGWRLLAELPQDRIGHVVAAQHQGDSPLTARFRLTGESEQIYLGHVESISTTAVLDTSGLDQESSPFEIKIAVDEIGMPLARPGMNAQVRILCGRRALGYVWLHDIWETAFSWFLF
ncbi:MAG: efflux RND transporter periplasmic adaptor subunit [Planctomycetes bacterium]|nr:efflux RND transporter periplasmic adaptor subunit [Planctomycetota bacterium]